MWTKKPMFKSVGSPRVSHHGAGPEPANGANEAAPAVCGQQPAGLRENQQGRGAAFRFLSAVTKIGFLHDFLIS